MEKPKYKPEQTLMEAIDFTREDLLANQKGLLGPVQRVELGYDRHMQTLYSGLTLLFLLLLILLAIGNHGETHLVIVCIGMGGGFLHVLSKRQNFVRDLREGSVRIIEGRVHLDINEWVKQSWRCQLTVENHKWYVTRTIFLAFKNGDPYRIYFAPHTQTLLSAEWLRDE